MAFSRVAADKAPPADRASLRQQARRGALDRALPPDPEQCSNILLDGLFPTGPSAYDAFEPVGRGVGQPKAVASAADLVGDIPRQPRELRAPGGPRRGAGGAGSGQQGPAPPPAPAAPAEPPPLPEDAGAWESREKDLWFKTEGTFHPRRALGGEDGRRGRSLPPRGSVSVVVPTSEAQQERHRLLWECFEAQEWDCKELVVVETYHYNPSDFFTRLQWKEKRLVYIGFHRPRGRDFTTALKRNLGVHLAIGEFVAHFDDRGLYAPQYLDCMIGRLCQGKKGSRPVAATLSRWYTMDPRSGSLGVFSPPEWAREKGLADTDPAVRKLLFGEAFSLVYRREAALELPFRDCEAGAEVDFCTRIMDREGSSMVALLEDTRGVCLHTLRGGAGAEATYEAAQAPQEEADGLEAVNCEAFDTYMRAIVEPAFNAPVIPPEERRVHPEDGKVYTLSEFREVCKDEFAPEEIEDYWRNKCTPMLDVAKPQAPKRKAEEGRRRMVVEAAPLRREDRRKAAESKSLLTRLESAWEEAKAEERARVNNPFRFAETAEPVAEKTAARGEASKRGAVPAMEELLALLDGEEADPAAAPAPPSAAPAPLPAEEAEAAPLPSMADLLSGLDQEEDEAVGEPPPAQAVGEPGEAPALPSMAELLADLDEDDEVVDVPAAAAVPPVGEAAGAAVPGMDQLLAQLDAEEGDAPAPAAGGEGGAAVPGMAELLAQLDGEEPSEPAAWSPPPEEQAPAVPGMAELLAQLDGEAPGEEVD